VRLNEILFEKRKDYEFVKKAIQNKKLWPGSKGDPSSVGVIGGDSGNTFITRGPAQYAKQGSSKYINPNNAGPLPIQGPTQTVAPSEVKVPDTSKVKDPSTAFRGEGELGWTEPGTVTVPGRVGSPFPSDEQIRDPAVRPVTAFGGEGELGWTEPSTQGGPVDNEQDRDESPAFAPELALAAEKRRLEAEAHAAALLQDKSQIEKRNAMEVRMAAYLAKKEIERQRLVASQTKIADDKLIKINDDYKAALAAAAASKQKAEENRLKDIADKQRLEARLIVAQKMALATAASDARLINTGEKYADKLIKDALEDVGDAEYAAAIEAQFYADIRRAIMSDIEREKVLKEKLAAWKLEQAKIEVTNQDRVNALVQGDPDDDDAMSVLTVAEIRSLIDRQAKEKVEVNVDDFSKIAVMTLEADKIVNPGDRFHPPKSFSAKEIEDGWKDLKLEVGKPITHPAIHHKNGIVAERARESLNLLNKKMMASGQIDENGNLTAYGKGLSEGNATDWLKFITDNDSKIIGGVLIAAAAAGVFAIIFWPPATITAIAAAAEISATVKAALIAAGLLAVAKTASAGDGRAPPIRRPITSFPSNNFNYDFNTMTLADINAEINRINTEMRKPGGYTKELDDRLIVLKKHKRIKQRNK